MSGILVFVPRSDAEADPLAAELAGAGLRLAAEGGGTVTLALLDSPSVTAEPPRFDGVEQVVVVPSPLPHFEPHVAETALAGLIEELQPTVVLAGHTTDSLGFLPAVAARGGHGFASDITRLEWRNGRPRAERGAYGGQLVAELEFPQKEVTILLLRAGSFEPAAPSGGEPEIGRHELDLSDSARTERVELREPPAGDVDITKADFLLAIGRGVEDEASIPELAQLAEQMGATLCASRPLIDAGWMPSARQVGQSGKTVAPTVYLALGISGAVQHLAGIAEAKTTIAVNSDPRAQIFTVADYGVVGDLFDIAAELEQAFE